MPLKSGEYATENVTGRSMRPQNKDKAGPLNSLPGLVSETVE